MPSAAPHSVRDRQMPRAIVLRRFATGDCRGRMDVWQAGRFVVGNECNKSRFSTFSAAYTVFECIDNYFLYKLF
jgi:hypothetical protein